MRIPARTVFTFIVFGFCLLWLATGCRNAQQTTPPSAPAPFSTEWVSLFNGKNFDGWHCYGKESVGGWEILADGVMMGIGKGGDIVTDQAFDNFALQLEWKISSEGNSGIFYHVVDDPEKYHSVYLTGPEYQLIDDEGWPGPLEEWQKTGSNYAMHLASARPTKAVGEWNHSQIVVDGSRVEHWLNGQKILAFESWTEDWQQRVANSKWKDTPDYGLARSGSIALQDHGDTILFRNIQIRALR
ncbi:MAG: DUF1080 domain-containing protein [Bacteroidota bacterium]